MLRIRGTRVRGERGQSVIEFTLVGIPVIFVLISTFEMARGMWTYDTLAHCVREGVRYASVRGYLYSDSTERTPTLAEAARRVRETGVGLDPTLLQLTWTAGTGASAVSYSCSLAECLQETSRQWPPPGLNMPWTVIGLRAEYPFRSAIAMFWPGAGSVNVFPAFRLPASASEEIHF